MLCVTGLLGVQRPVLSRGRSECCGGEELKEYRCIEVHDHKDIGGKIDEEQQNGWRLHTYACAGSAGLASAFVRHYLLFERGEDTQRRTSS